jgi:glycosyltransferase involved in cell wall biosynthesis
MTAVAGNSQSVIDQLRDEEQVHPDKLLLTYNGISMEPFERPLDVKTKRQELGLSDDTLVLVIVANLIPYKGHTDLLSALAKIKSAMAKDWVLLIVGRDDGLRRVLEEQASTLGIAENVRFLGERHDVMELLRIANLGLLCSHEEGFSNALLEGMAAGLPMIATDVGGNAEAVLDGTTGLLVPPKDPEAIGRAILRLAHDPALAREMGMAGHARVGERFSLEACIDGYEALYRAIGVTRPCTLPPCWERLDNLSVDEALNVP